MEQHERHEAERLGLVGHQRTQEPTQADGLGRQAAANQVGACAGGVPLVEEEVEDGQHGGRSFHQLVGRGHLEGDARVAYLALRPHEPLSHGGLGYQEGAGDLGRRHAGEGAQGQRDLGLEGQ